MQRNTVIRRSSAELTRIWSIADEGLERSADSRASRVHFLRFELGGTNTTDASRDLLLNDLD
jgi:hypothetical protein